MEETSIPCADDVARVAVVVEKLTRAFIGRQQQIQTLVRLLGQVSSRKSRRNPSN